MTRPRVLIVGAGFAGFYCADPMSGMLAGQEPAGGYLSADDARQTAGAILAHNQGGWPE